MSVIWRCSSSILQGKDVISVRRYISRSSLSSSQAFECSKELDVKYLYTLTYNGLIYPSKSNSIVCGHVSKVDNRIIYFDNIKELCDMFNKSYNRCINEFIVSGIMNYRKVFNAISSNNTTSIFSFLSQVFGIELNKLHSRSRDGIISEIDKAIVSKVFIERITRRI